MNLARLELPALRLVVLSAEEGSLSAAAPRAAMSLSGASHKLKHLEDALGQRIFMRSHRGLVPTSAGLVTIALCRRIVSLAQELHAPSR